MRLGIMQPYFFPYLGYFSLMAATDRWIVFDTPQYIRKGWVHRNRVLKKGGGDWKYIRVPVVKCPRETPIYQVLIDETHDWQDEVLRNLDYYRDAHAPFYQETFEFLQATLKPGGSNLSSALVRFLVATCEYIQLKVDLEVFSEMRLPMGEVAHPGQWALRICESVGAEVYINPPGGREIFDRRDFELSGIGLMFLDATLPAYSQGRRDFVPGLSIIDALMWNPRENVLAMIKDYTLER